jgi:hypothetical protein
VQPTAFSTQLLCQQRIVHTAQFEVLVVVGASYCTTATAAVMPFIVHESALPSTTDVNCKSQIPRVTATAYGLSTPAAPAAAAALPHPCPPHLFNQAVVQVFQTTFLILSNI